MGQRIESTFNLGKAPWWGGFFERLICSTDRLRGVLKGSLDEQELQDCHMKSSSKLCVKLKLY